jgi:uncharacterized protein (TIGR03437 family)
MKRGTIFILALTTLATGRLAAQCSAAPASYSAMCTQIQGYLSSFGSTIAAGWNGSKPPVAFSTDLLAANANIGVTGLLSASAMSNVQTSLDGFSRAGVQAVTIAVSFPILYQPFYTYMNQSQNYASVLSFYQSVVAAARQHGMKVIIESSVMFPSVATSLPLQAYYATLSSSDVTNGRAQVAQIIAQQLQPDWLNLGSEPDTQSALLGLGAEYTPQEWASEISTIVSQLRAAGIAGKPLIGAGIGSWQTNGSQYVQALTGTGIDYFDTHIYSANMGFLKAAVTYLDMAQAAGLRAAISEAWLHKMTDSQLTGLGEFGIINVLSQTKDLNPYNFWIPIDAEFIHEMVTLGYWKNLYYVSPFNSDLMFAYLNYNNVASLSGSEVSQQEVAAAEAALSVGTLSPIGEFYKADITSGAVPMVATGGTVLAAPGSIISFYGANLGASSQAAQTLPLPTTLGGAKVMITDSTGLQATAALFFASPLQINAVLPDMLAPGPGIVTIFGNNGSVSSAIALASVTPGLFTQSGSGKGVAAAQVVTNHADGSQTTTDVFQCSGGGSCQPAPINLSAGPSALVLYGTGFRNDKTLSDVTVQIGNQSLPVFFSGAELGHFEGLDQVNVMLPSSLAGLGTVNVTLTVAGAVSNVATVNFQ